MIKCHLRCHLIDVPLYSPTANTWTPLRESLPVAVAYAAGVSLGSEFWVMGGNDDSGQKTSYIQVTML
jgi:hypothetical protein